MGGHIDVPAPEAVVDPFDLVISGWAHASGSAVSAVDLWLGPVWLGRTAADRPRPDVAESLDEPAAGRSGFELRVRRPPWPEEGRGVVRAQVTLADGGEEELEPVRVRLATVVGSVDLPRPDSEVDPTGLRVWGWAQGARVPVSRIEVFLDDRLLGRAGLGRPRPDVAEVLGEGGAVLSGWELFVTEPVPTTPGGGCLRTVVTLVDATVEELDPVAVRWRAPPRPSDAGAAEVGAGGAIRLAVRGPTRPVRLLVSARGLNRGGSQLRMAELVEHLGRAGDFETTVISPEEGVLRSRLEAAGAAVEVVPRVPLDDLAGYEQSLSGLIDRIDRHHDLVFGATVTSFPAVDAAIRAGVPAVLRIGESASLATVVHWLSGRLDPQVERRARWAVAGASAVISNSRAAQAAYRADGFTGPFVVVPTGVDVTGALAYSAATDRGAVRRELGVEPHERLMVCAGEIWPIKGQALLVAALERIRGRAEPLRCVLLGVGDPAYTGALAAFVNRHDLGGVVRMLPFAEDLRPWWRAADLAVCPSESEALPAAVLEAMSFGLPVLAARVGDLEEVVEPGVTGWLCDPSDLGSMTDGLEAVAGTTPAALAAMGGAALEVAALRYDRVGLLARITDLLRGAVDGVAPT